MSGASSFQTFFRFRARGCGNTFALIRGMLIDPNSVMLVSSYEQGRCLSKQYGIAPERFISVRDGLRNLQGRQFKGPVVVDLPAIADILEQVECEHVAVITQLRAELAGAQINQNLNLFQENAALRHENATLKNIWKSKIFEIKELEAENQRLQNVIAN